MTEGLYGSAPFSRREAVRALSAGLVGPGTDGAIAGQPGEGKLAFREPWTGT